MKTVKICLLCAAMTNSAFGVISLNNAILTGAQNSSGNDVAAGTLGLIVVDTNGDGFGGVQEGTYSKSTMETDSYFIDGVNDRIVAIGSFASGGGFDTTIRLTLESINEIRTSSDNPSGPFTANTQFAIYWFSDLTESNNSFTVGDSYGMARFTSLDMTDTTSSNGNDFILLEGSNAYDVTVTGAKALANLTVQAVPEPTSLALIGLGTFGLIARRRRG